MKTYRAEAVKILMLSPFYWYQTLAERLAEVQYLASILELGASI